MKKIDNEINWEGLLSSQEEFEKAIQDFKSRQTYAEVVYDFFRYTIPAHFSELFYEVKMKYQVLTRGYSDRNVWNMRVDIAELNIKLLTHLKENCVGHPSDLTQKSWDKILGKMIDGFRAVIEMDNLSYGKGYEKTYAKLEKKFKEGMELYTKHFRNLWD